MRFALSILLVGSVASSTVAMPAPDVVTSGAGGVRGAFLSVGAGARAAGMGEAFTAIADDASAGAWNPGGLGQLRTLGAVAAFDTLGAGIGISYAAVAVPAGPVTIGSGVTVMSFGAYDVRDAAGVKSGSENLSEMAGSVAVAAPHPEWLGGSGWSGFSIEVAREAVGVTSLGFGFGSLVPLGSRAAMGWSIQHLGPATSGFSLPGSVKAGLSFEPLHAVQLAADAGYLLGAKEPFAAVGVEATPYRALQLRCGYRYRPAASSPSGLVGVAAGAGVRIGSLGLDYAYQPFGDLTVSHRVSLVYRPDVNHSLSMSAKPSSDAAPAVPSPGKPAPKKGGRGR